jgi:hypothetical protein
MHLCWGDRWLDETIVFYVVYQHNEVCHQLVIKHNPSISIAAESKMCLTGHMWSYLCSAAISLSTETWNKKIQNSTNNLSTFVQKCYSAVCCIIDRKTYFSQQDINVSSIIHKSNCHAAWQIDYKYNYLHELTCFVSGLIIEESQVRTY